MLQWKKIQYQSPHHWFFQWLLDVKQSRYNISQLELYVLYIKENSYSGHYHVNQGARNNSWLGQQSSYSRYKATDSTCTTTAPKGKAKADTKDEKWQRVTCVVLRRQGEKTLEDKAKVLSRVKRVALKWWQHFSLKKFV